MPTMYDMTLAYGSISSIEHVDYFSVDDFFVTQELVDEVQGAGKIIYAWTVNDPPTCRASSIMASTVWSPTTSHKLASCTKPR